VVGEHAGSYINDLKKNLAGITSVAQLNQITSGTFTYGSPTINLAANSNYKFNYSINFAAKSHTGSIDLNISTLDGFTNNLVGGSFSLLADPFTQPGEALNIREGPAAVPGAPVDTITVGYKFINDGAIAKRIDHKVTYTNGATHTASGVSTR
jgi:hypothetical protein